jgi:paired amphipathic helix protein Sin3a
MTTPDELLFFDRAKKALESRETYDEFLRLLNLFAKDIIDAKSLIQSAQIFLGDGDLFSQFKDLMGWDERLHSVEYGPPGSIRTGPPDALSAERTDEGQGISYRRLPASVSHQVQVLPSMLIHMYSSSLGDKSCMFGPR